MSFLGGKELISVKRHVPHVGPQEANKRYLLVINSSFVTIDSLNLDLFY